MQQPAGGGASGSDAFDEGAGAALGAGFGTGGGPLRKDEHESARVTKLARGIEFRLPRFLHACSKNCTTTSARAGPWLLARARPYHLHESFLHASAHLRLQRVFGLTDVRTSQE